MSTLGQTHLSDPHPHYKKPTIVEATCEIGFISATEDRLSSRDLYNVLGGEFPEMQPVGSMSLQIVFQQAGMLAGGPVNVAPSVATAFRFGTADNHRFVQASRSSFIYQITRGPYYGWDDYRSNLLKNWTALRDVLKPQQVAKVGMRFINRIEMTADHSQLSDWLKPSADLPESFIGSKGHFMARLESSPETDIQKLITIAGQPPDSAQPYGSVILDIDCISTATHDVADELIFAKLEVLHENIWAVFSSAKTSRLEAHLNGE